MMFGSGEDGFGYNEQLREDEIKDLETKLNALVDAAIQSLDRTEFSRENLKQVLVGIGYRNEMVARGVKN